jgi:hypothetical protein
LREGVVVSRVKGDLEGRRSVTPIRIDVHICIEVCYRVQQCVGVVFTNPEEGDGIFFLLCIAVFPFYLGLIKAGDMLSIAPYKKAHTVCVPALADEGIVGADPVTPTKHHHFTLDLIRKRLETWVNVI